jgi:hypothetical protein
MANGEKVVSRIDPGYRLLEVAGYEMRRQMGGVRAYGRKAARRKSGRLEIRATRRRDPPASRRRSDSNTAKNLTPVPVQRALIRLLTAGA